MNNPLDLILFGLVVGFLIGGYAGAFFERCDIADAEHRRLAELEDESEYS